MARPRWSILVPALALAPFLGCGGGGSPTPTAPSAPAPTPPLSVTVTPGTPTLAPGGSQAFTAAVTHSSDQAVTWTVEGTGHGTISSAGLYTAPMATGAFTVRATAHANPSISGTASITVSGGGVITPGDPGAADLAITVNTTTGVRAISPFIYGMNFYGGYANMPGHLTLNREGGNRWTAYNWETNASNSGSDWGPYSNDTYLGGGSTPAGAIPIAADRTQGVATLMTVQMQGYASADTNGLVNLGDPNHLANRFKQVGFKKGGAFADPPSTADGFVYMDEELNYLQNHFPADLFTSPTAPLFVDLDNEPELWGDTHAEIQSGLISPAAYLQKTRDLTRAIKAVAPQAQLFGPVHYGFAGLVNWQGSSGYTGSFWFTDDYLQQMKAASDAAGLRLLDAYDWHWYSEVYAHTPAIDPGDGQLKTMNIRVVSADRTDLSDEMVDAIAQSPRSLWDDTYLEGSWVASYLGAPIRLLPRIQAKIDAAFPGTKMVIGEYDNGGGRHIAGALAQADNLGAFGRYGVYAASFWGGSDDATRYAFTYAGFKMFRDFDGAGGHFGDTSVDRTVSDNAKASAWASIDGGHDDRVVLVLTNKAKTAQTASLRCFHTRTLHTAQVFELSGTNTTPVRKADIALTLANALKVTLPGRSVTTLVLIP
ncbi:MAG TPA: glycoside hydrolase family 44 protein [Holophagaceae bacterium]|nr:glycoside hydrolase family 44 protein [Holophagaceae bacterium]